MSRILSVNVGRQMACEHTATSVTGIDKRAVGSVDVFPPGPRSQGGASGVVGDFIGDLKHHGGDLQAVYAYALEDLQFFEQLLQRPLNAGVFGENITTGDFDVNAAVVGERWRIGDAVLQVSVPRIPCNTFRVWIGERGWLKTFTRSGRSGTYLRVLAPGTLRPGDEIEVFDVPAHQVTVQQLFWALTIAPETAPEVLRAEADLCDESLRLLRRRETFTLG